MQVFSIISYQRVQTFKLSAGPYDTALTCTTLLVLLAIASLRSRYSRSLFLSMNVLTLYVTSPA